MKYSEENLRIYIEKCFKDSFKAENREYNEKLWNFEWVMIKNSVGIYQLYPIMWCKYERILRRVRYRLENNLMKNFGIQYGNTDEMRCLFYDDGQIDPNFTQAMFKTKRGNVSLSIIDEKTNPYENDLSGECMVAYTYENLIFKYWGLDARAYNMLSENDEKRHLPDSVKENWENFRELYNETFEAPLGSYDIIYSSGIKRI